MEIINNQYVEVSRYDVFKIMLAANEMQNEHLSELCSQLFTTILDYDRQKKCVVPEVYVSTSSPLFTGASEIMSIPVKWESVRNACVNATLDDKFAISYRLSLALIKKEVYPDDLQDLLNYVLENGIDVRERVYGEQERPIYDEQSNTIKEGKIFESKGKQLGMSQK